MSESNQQKNLEQFSELLSSGKMDSTRRLINHLHPAEVANLLESLPIPKRRIPWGLLETKISGEVLLEISDNTREDLIKVTGTQELVHALKDLDVDELADLFKGLPKIVSRNILESMATQERKRLEQVASYDEHSAGGLMDVSTVTVRGDITLDIVRRYLRMKQKLPEHTDNLIVVDYNNYYLGCLSLGDILTKSRNTLIKDVMDTDIEGIDVATPATEVARIFEDMDLTSAPVIDANGILVGRITIDDVVDVIRTEARHQEFGAAGLPPDENLFNNATTSAQRRGIWLGTNLITAFLASWVISLFQDTLQQVIALAILIPVVTSMGGIAGSQTLTLIIRGLATNQVGRSNFSSILLKELNIGLLSSLMWGILVGGLVAFWLNSFLLSIIIVVALIINFICASLSGVYIPVLMKKLNMDPALGGSVLLTTITDVIGLFTLLGLGSLFLL